MFSGAGTDRKQVYCRAVQSLQIYSGADYDIHVCTLITDRHSLDRTEPKESV